jgi:hypothetical protein
MRHSSKDSSES